MYLTHDRALTGQSGRRIGAAYWPVLVPTGGQWRFFVRTVATGRDSVVRWSSRLLGRGIRVSPMSNTWLRTHEAEYSKHGPEI
jgi:hypothetical protein